MPETQQDIDALLAEVNALAEETVAGIAGSESFAPSAAHPTSLAVANPPSHQPASSSAAALASPAAAPSCDTPANPMQSISPLLRRGRIATGTGPAQLEDVSRILSIEVPIIVQLSHRTMPLSEILNLTTGSIIEFDKPADSELELKVNNKCVGSGQAVKVGENFGLRVVRIGSVRERIQALGAN